MEEKFKDQAKTVFKHYKSVVIAFGVIVLFLGVLVGKLVL